MTAFAETKETTERFLQDLFVMYMGDSTAANFLSENSQSVTTMTDDQTPLFTHY